MSAIPNDHDRPREPYVFSLAQGGPTYQLFLSVRLSGTSLQLLRRRITVMLAIVWLPLLLLATLQGHAWSGIDLPFLADIGAQVRFLVALPLLFVAERVVHQQMSAAIPLFIERGIIKDAQRTAFADIIVSARRTLGSIPIELAVLALVYAIGFSGELQQIHGSSWYGIPADGKRTPTWAGWWLSAVSLPLFQFLLLRWYVRLLVWWRFLWQVSRLDLHLQPLVADRLGGLGFVSRLSAAFALVLLAQSALASGLIADQLFHAGASLSDFRLEIAGVAVFLLATVVVPLLSFTPCLARAKLLGLEKMEEFSLRYTRQFAQRWLRDDSIQGDPSLLGDPDIQSLADQGSAYELVRNMRVLPIGITTLAFLLGAALAPMLPLLLTTFSIEEMASGVVKFLF